MKPKELAQLCREYADSKKAEDIVVLDVSGVSSITDYFVIATANSEPHVRSIWHEIVDRLQRDHGQHAGKPEGAQQSQWVVVDYFDVVVHVMVKRVREEYNLEGLWNDATAVRPPVRRRAKKL
ncbi:MAG: ribosome silencing factor [Pedosphaera sp.]|nr:ribosome silencing factor [Pedosphaera sp.]MSU42610.1 ribosome silencing factor [Pedosphaera sp.]